MIPGLGRCPGERNSYLFQYSGLEIIMDHIFHRDSKSWTWLRNFHSGVLDNVFTEKRVLYSVPNRCCHFPCPPSFGLIFPADFPVPSTGTFLLPGQRAMGSAPPSIPFHLAHRHPMSDSILRLRSLCIGAVSEPLDTWSPFRQLSVSICQAVPLCFQWFVPEACFRKRPETTGTLYSWCLGVYITRGWPTAKG